MHKIVIDELELHLSGTASASFYRHLEECIECKVEVEEVSVLSSSFAMLREQADFSPLPSPAFYSRVATRINEQQQSSSWRFFSLSQPIFRRIAFASLMLLAGLGSYLVATESSYEGADAASIIAQAPGPQRIEPSENALEQEVSQPAGHDQDFMLVQLASYHQ